MSTPRFLLLENNSSDVEAIQALLIDCGMDYELLWVETRADFVAALETETFDLILANCGMLEADGMAALEIAAALRSESPLITIAASVDEEQAIATLKQGATDYVLKPRLGRLVLGVQRALRETVERREQKTARRESETKYRTLFESVDQGFCICEMLFDENGEPTDYRFLEVNSVFASLTGLEAATGKTIRELVPNLESTWIEIYGRVVQTGESIRIENESTAMNRWFNVNAFRIGEPHSHQFAVLFTNITDRKQLEQNRDRFLAVGSDLQVITGYNGYFQWVSPTLKRLLGWTLDEITSRPWTDFVHPDDLPESLSETDSLISGNETIAFENRYRHKDGSYRRFRWNCRFYPEEQLFYGTAVDITEAKRIEGDRKQAEAALQDSEEQSRNILESIDDAFFALDENWRFTYVNQTAEILLHRIPGDLLGKVFWEEFPGVNGSELEQMHRRVMGDRVAESLTAFYPDHDRWYEVRSYPAANGITIYFKNVSDRIQAEETLHQKSAELEQQVQKFNAVMSSVPDFIYMFDLAGRFIDVNKPLLDLLQKSHSEVVGRTFFELDYPEDLAARLQNQIQEVIQTRQPIRDETPYSSAIGTRAYEYIFFPVFTAENAVEMVAGVTRDITDRIQAEETLRESETRFRTLADNMSQFAWMADPNGWIFWYNHRWFDYTGTTLEEMQGWGWQQVHHPDHVDRVVEHIRHCFETGVSWEDTFPLRGTDGNYRWFLSRAIPIKDEAGKIVRWFGTNTDITDQKQIEAELRQKNAILDVINESAPTPIFVKDRQGRIIYANPATLEVLGKSAAEVIGYRDGTLYPSVEANRIMETDQRVMETGQTEVVEESPDGIRTFLGMKAPYRNETGEVIGLIGISNDISDRKRIEAQREQLLQQEQAAREAAEQANRIKDEFLAVVSHELRTPLNPILGWSKLLRSGKLPPEKAAIALGIIERNAQQQAQLIDDLLDISRILQNKLTLAIVPIDLTAVIANALETVRLSAEAKGIELKFEVAKLKAANSCDRDLHPANPSPFQVLGDASRLQQIVWNLLSNAIKFTPENGRVEVKLENDEFSILSSQLEDSTQNISYGDAARTKLKTQNSKPYAQITISDNGKGIQPEFLPHLFEAFRQEDNTITRKFGGLGLGLSIVQQLVALHGGTIAAASDGVGKGATFAVRFAIAPHESASPTRPSSTRQATDLSGIQILVVDDITDSREFVAFALEQAGAIVTPANSAQAAMELLAQMKPDVIISDIGMPDCNGYELMQQIRTHFTQLQTTPAIALSAYASEIDQQQALAAGFQRHLAKPIDPEALVKTVAMLTQSE